MISFGSLFYVNNKTVCSTVLNLYKDNMMIKEVCLLSWLGKWIPYMSSSNDKDVLERRCSISIFHVLGGHAGKAFKLIVLKLFCFPPT